MLTLNRGERVRSKATGRTGKVVDENRVGSYHDVRVRWDEDHPGANKRQESIVPRERIERTP